MDVLMPQLGETVAEGKITKWFKSAGDAVKPGDNLFEIETDKVSMEVPSTDGRRAVGNPRRRRRGGAGRRRRGGDRGRGRCVLAQREPLLRRRREAPPRAVAAAHCSRVRPPVRATAAGDRGADQARSVLRGAHARRAISARRGLPAAPS